MAREITLAGFRMSYEEWRALDATTREELLRALVVVDRDAAPREPEVVARPHLRQLA